MATSLPSMQVSVRLFAGLRERAGREVVELSCATAPRCVTRSNSSTI